MSLGAHIQTLIEEWEDAATQLEQAAQRATTRFVQAHNAGAAATCRLAIKDLRTLQDLAARTEEETP